MLLCLKLQYNKGDRWITCHIPACAHDRWDAMQSFQQLLGHAPVMWFPRYENTCWNKKQMQISLSASHFHWSWWHVAFCFLWETQWSLFPLPIYWFALMEVWVAACQAMYLVIVAWYFALPAFITAMVSVQRSMITFLLTWWEAAPWQLTFRSPPSLYHNSYLSLLGPRNCNKSWNFHSPGRGPPAEWFSTSGAPCWAPSTTATKFLRWIFFHITQFFRGNRP